MIRKKGDFWLILTGCYFIASIVIEVYMIQFMGLALLFGAKWIVEGIPQQIIKIQR